MDVGLYLLVSLVVFTVALGLVTIHHKKYHKRFRPDDIALCLMVGVLWPGAVPGSLVVGFCIGLSKLMNKL